MLYEDTSDIEQRHVRVAELDKFTKQCDRHLRTSELLHKHSADAGLIVL